MPWIDLDDAKAHLNKSGTADDGELEEFMFAACAAIEEIKGHVDPVTVTVTRRAVPLTDNHRHRAWWGPHRQWFLELAESPVLSVTSVAVATGGGLTTPVAAYDQISGVQGWHLDETLLFVPTAGLYVVAYQAGRDPVPPNFRLAALELTAHLWRGSQLNQSSGRPQIGGDQMMVVPHLASALPYRVRELLGVYGNVVNDHVIIA